MHAQTILSWQENLPKAELPPEWMWHLGDELEEWFDELELRREQERDGGGDDVPEDSVMVQNEYARGMRR